MSVLSLSINSDKRERSDNWTSKEKLVLLDLCAVHMDDIENRKHDAYTAKKKLNAWAQIHGAFSQKFGNSRHPQRLKEQWRRLKSMAKLELRNTEGFLENTPENLGLQLNYMREKINGSADDEDNELRSKMCAHFFGPKVELNESTNGQMNLSLGTHESENSGNASYDYTDDEERSMAMMQNFQQQLPEMVGSNRQEDSRASTSSESPPYTKRKRGGDGEEEILTFQRREHEQRMAFLDAEHCARMEILELEKRKFEIERDKAEIEKDIAAMKRIKVMEELGIK